MNVCFPPIADIPLAAVSECHAEADETCAGGRVRQADELSDLATILRRNIRWVNEVGAPRWICSIDGERAHLVMNDFPDEPLYTLTFKGLSLDLDDAPETWVIPSA